MECFLGIITQIGSGFNAPSGVAVDAVGNVYVADTGNNAIKMIDAASGNWWSCCRICGGDV